jgi:hypothetical protein
MMFQQQLRRVGCVSCGVRSRSLGTAHAQASTSKLM